MPPGPRRTLRRLGASVALGLVLASSATPAGEEILVTLGGTGPRQALLWARVRLDGLQARTPYEYRVRGGSGEARGRFVTAPEPDDPAPVTLHWSGDLGGGGRCRLPGVGYPIFQAMAARRPDLFLFVGDTIYADLRCPRASSEPGSDFVATTLAGYRRKHRYNREDPLVQAYFRQTTVEAIWDDHEVANDFAGTVEPLMPVGRQAFLDYWPLSPPSEEPGRLYRRLRWGGLLDVFVLDTRQYRSPNSRGDGPDKTMLGPAQLKWLVDGVRDSRAVWKVVVTSVPLSTPTGRGARDSWARLDLLTQGARPTGFERELLAILEAFRQGPVRNLVWLTADIHHSAAYQLEPWPGFVFHELVAGPLRAGLGHPGPLSSTLRPRRLYAEGGFDGFGELAVTPAGMAVRLLDADGRVRFETRLAPEGPG